MKVTRKQFLSTVATGLVGAAMTPRRSLADTAKPEYSADLFAPYVGTTFHLDVSESRTTVDAVLEKIDARTGSPGTRQFSLQFATPMGELLAERTYTARHDQLGELAIFLIPIHRDEQGHGLHRADFNLLQAGSGPDQNTRKPRTLPARSPK